MKDMIYFISSAVEPRECEQMEEWLLNTYFVALRDALALYQPNLDADEVVQEYRAMFSIAWADFQRFIKGWSPSHYKINYYSERVTQKALEYIKGVD